MTSLQSQATHGTTQLLKQKLKKTQTVIPFLTKKATKFLQRFVSTSRLTWLLLTSLLTSSTGIGSSLKKAAILPTAKQSLATTGLSRMALSLPVSTTLSVLFTKLVSQTKLRQSLRSSQVQHGKQVTSPSILTLQTLQSIFLLTSVTEYSVQIQLMLTSSGKQSQITQSSISLLSSVLNSSRMQCPRSFFLRMLTAHTLSTKAFRFGSSLQ